MRTTELNMSFESIVEQCGTIGDLIQLVHDVAHIA